ncbi:hypothetical protein EW026_g3460 [Hermanssonia centrifuga]|uniref:Uncharacterized protein n=1 Tax=Hermanssonia centrifuga TaxID=98765 RepID=A0A4S4KK29_9APHY|nr:hypothetical protein EW026_g3460 [Hermanssonia centrifuga]
MKALTTIETIFYFMTIALFLLNTSTLLLQFICEEINNNPSTGIFVPLMVLSFAPIIIGTINYAVPKGYVSPTFIYGLFWTYVSLSVIVCFPMLMIWYNKPHDLNMFTPAWAFLLFPMMLVGVVAFNVLHVIPASDSRALGILLAAYIFQGLGFFMTFFYICIYIIRIMTTGFMNGGQANGAFVACGPPGFTALALLNLGEQAQAIIIPALMLFGLAVFFFLFGILPYCFKLHAHLNEILGCWSLTFPNVGWIVTSRKLGDVFQTNFFDVWNTVMTIAMCITWIVLFALTFVAFWEGKIFISPKEDTARDVRHWRVRRHAEDVELGYHTHDTEQTTESNLRLGAAGSETSAMNSGMSTPIPKEVVTAGR